MSSVGTSETRRGFRLRDGDGPAIVWAIACCWLIVWGNYLLIALGLTAEYIVPFDLLVVPMIVSAGFWLLRRLGL